MSLAATLRELRAEKKVSLQAVADAIGVSRPHIWELEKGKTKNPSLGLLKSLASYYGVSLDYLAGVNDDIEPGDRLSAMARELDINNLSDEEWEKVQATIKFAMDLLNKGK